MTAPQAVPRAIERLVFALVVVSCAYFVQGGGHNQNSRYALVRAIVERHTVEIDAYAGSTQDLAIFDGHAYSDKAPGLALVATIPYALAVRFVQPRDQLEPSSLALHLLVLATIALATAFAAVALLRLLVGAGIGLVPALIAILGWLFGTNAFAYAGLFYAHQLVAALFVLALAAVRAAALAESPRRRFVLAAAGGLAIGFVVLSEFTAIVLAIVVAGYALATLGWRRMLPFALGAIPPAITLFVYNALCFGSPFHLGYDSLSAANYDEGMRHGFFGFGVPDLHVIGQLLVSEYRGWLPLSPFLVLALPGFYWMLVDRSWRALGIACLACVLALLLLISGFPFWTGGSALGPRHLVPALPGLIIPVAVAIERARRRLPRVTLAIAGGLVTASIAICTVCVGVQPELFENKLDLGPARELAPADPAHPLRDTVWPLFELGYVSNKATKLGHTHYAAWWPNHDRDAYNLGERLGVDGTNSFLPLIGIWAVFAIAIVLQIRRAALAGTHVGGTAA